MNTIIACSFWIGNDIFYIEIRELIAKFVFNIYGN